MGAIFEPGSRHPGRRVGTLRGRMSQPATRIAMWSGPRNLSTAMMRSFSSRPDTFITDEPFYAHYLRETGIGHPGRDLVIAQGQTDWRKVVDAITGPVPDGKAVWYQKHMAHHMLPHVDVARLGGLTHAFLIRSPKEVILSYTKVHPEMTINETGLPYQMSLFERAAQRTGATPAVIDARDVLTDPAGVLSVLCDRLGIAWTEAMLSWPAGPHPQDGPWAPYWYDSVYRSTGFDKYAPRDEPVPDHLRGLLDEAQALYDRLAAHRITTADTPR